MRAEFPQWDVLQLLLQFLWFVVALFVTENGKMPQQINSVDEEPLPIIRQERGVQT